MVALDEWLTSAARARPDHPAVVAEGRMLTYAELDRAAAACARRLGTLGVGRGDVVGTTLSPGLAFCELLHALPRLGAALAPLDPRAPGETPDLVVTTPPTAPEAELDLLEHVDPDTVHTVIRSSGTTGVPKAIELTYGNHVASALASADALGVDSGDRWLCPLPLHHVGGLAVLIRSVLNRTTTLIHERFDVRRVMASLQAGEATLVSLVPTMLARLRDAGLREAPGLRAVALGGGPVAPDLLEWAAGAGIPVVPVYGMTETASQVVAGIPGRALRGVQLRVDEAGEVLVRGPMVARGAAGEDGWLRTGDRGRLDSRGRLHLEGRIKDLIVTGGEKVAPPVVEAALAAHPAVADAGVVGVPDAEWGEVVTAFVVLREPVQPAALRAWCRERLAPHEVPKRVVAVDELPRNAAGKLVRDRL
ncbi:MAG TPA: AMP-binding protein [Thermoleophilaceae bacterium]|nr:AMP-binding protein [Thermoleophilaceae bacterium]